MAEESALSRTAADSAEQSVLWRAAAEASERIDRVVRGARDTLARAGVESRLVEGSALSAELSSCDELVRRFASRASLSVAREDLARAGRALADAGWHAADPQGDIHILRTAARRGRHLVFALIDEASGGEAQGLHPAHPRAASLRDERLSRWRVRPAMTLGRQESKADELGRTVTETFELGLVESQGSGVQVP